MRDEMVEVLVKCKTNVVLGTLRVLLYILCALSVGASMIGFGLVGYIVAVVFGVAGYYAGMYSQVEYEYAYCNKELDIDVIYCQTKRKHITTLDLGKMEALVRVEGSRMGEYSRRQCVTNDYSTKKKENKDNVYALFYDGNMKYLFEPNERMINAIAYIAPRKIFKD